MERAIRKTADSDFYTQNYKLASTGTLVVYSGLRTDRSPKDKRIIKDDQTKDKVWWGSVNRPISTISNRFCRDLAIKYLKIQLLLFTSKMNMLAGTLK